MITPGEDGSAGLVFQTLKGAEIKFTLDSNLLHALGNPAFSKGVMLRESYLKNNRIKGTPYLILPTSPSQIFPLCS